jgi:hypothetical protein
MPTKTTTKKKAASKSIPKKTTHSKKNLVNKKNATSISRKQSGRPTEIEAHKKKSSKGVVVAEKANEKTKKLLHKLVEEPTESNLPPVEEKSPSVNNPNIVAPGQDKSIQRAEVRNYVKKQIRISGKKSRMKPAGKKPLW